MKYRAIITTVSTSLVGKESALSLVSTVKLEAHLSPEQIEALAVLQKSGFPVEVEVTELQATLMR